MKPRLTHLPIVVFCLLGIIWSSNFIYMKLASKYITPLKIPVDLSRLFANP